MIYKGIAGSNGIAIGQAYIHKKGKFAISRSMITPAAAAAEQGKIDPAVAVTRRQLEAIRQKTLAEIGPDEAKIFEAHLMILEDPAFLAEIRAAISEQHMTAAYATELITEKFAGQFAAIEDDYFKERAADIRDVGGRLLQNILGGAASGLENLAKPVVVIAADLTPSDTALMNKDYVLGFAVNVGGRTSHTAIMARSLQLPAVLGLGDITAKVADGDTVIVDGITGTVIVRPGEAELSAYQEKQRQYGEYYETLRQMKDLPAVTSDGRQVKMFANIGTPQESSHVLAQGGEGIGLYRTEFLYMDRDRLPDEEEQFTAYRSVIEQMAGRPVIIRTLDVGGDKKLPCLPLPEEANPFLGWRAIRLCLARPDIFRPQLRAILRASAYGPVFMMFPMISGVEEVKAARKMVEDVKSELLSEGIQFDNQLRIGIMVEIPAAAISAGALVDEVDFFSIGTNDLCQYTLAVDRMNEKIAALYQPLHPAILQLIKMTIDAGRSQHKIAGMCGEMAGDPLAAVVLLGLGLDEFSMSPASIPLVKQVIRSISYEAAQKMAAAVLAMTTPAEIKEYLQSALTNLNIKI